MHDTEKAEPIHYEGTLIGYILEIADGLWLPLDKAGKNYSGPTYKKDAEDVVRYFRDKKNPNT